MNPKPFSSLNHFTTPVAICVQPSAPTRRFIPSAAARAPRRAALGLGARRDGLRLGRPLRRALVLVRVELRAAGGVLLVLRLGLLLIDLRRRRVVLAATEAEL